MAIIVTTTEGVEGKRIKKYMGIVWASSSRSKSILHDIAAMLKSLWGGEIRPYKSMMNEARRDVLKQLAKNAEKMGADAVVGVEVGSTQIMPSTVDIFAYGTAVKLGK